MTKEQIDFCASILISIPGWSQESYDKVHKFNFEHIKENILKFKDDFDEYNQAFKLFLTYHIYQYNLDELPEVIEFAYQNKLTFNPYYAFVIDYWKAKDYKCPQESNLNIDENANILACCVLPNNIEGYSQGNLFDDNAAELILNRQNIKECEFCIKSGLSKSMHACTGIPLFVSKLMEYEQSKQFSQANKKKKFSLKKLLHLK